MDDSLKLIGAGPLEDLMRDHLAIFIERVEAIALVCRALNSYS